MWYHLPDTTLDVGLFELESDVDILKMCQMINPKFGYVTIYVIRMPAIAREYDIIIRRNTYAKSFPGINTSKNRFRRK